MIQLPKPPPSTGKGTAEQLESLRAYISTVVDQMNLAMQSIDKSLAALEGRKEGSNKTTMVQALTKQFITDKGVSMGWRYTVYNNGGLVMEKTVYTYPEHGTTSNVQGLVVSVSSPIAESLPFAISQGDVSGVDTTTGFEIVDGKLLDGNGSISFRIKSLVGFGGGSRHTVRLKLTGKMENISLTGGNST